MVKLLQALVFLGATTGALYAQDVPGANAQRLEEPMVIKTIVLKNVTKQSEASAIVALLRSLLPLNQVAFSTPLNAIMIRGTVDQIVAAEKIIAEQDQVKPQVTLDVAFVEVDSADLKQLGIVPPSGRELANPPQNEVNGSDKRPRPVAVVIPEVLGAFLATSTRTKILRTQTIQIPESSLRKGPSDRLCASVPVCAPVDVDALAAHVEIPNGAVSVDLAITKIPADRSVSVQVDVFFESTVTGGEKIAGVAPTIVRRTRHEARLDEGESMIVVGVPDSQDQREIVITITPHVVSPSAVTVQGTQPSAPVK